MPRPMMDVRSPAYQALLHERSLYQKYKTDYADVKRALETLTHLEKKTAQGFFTRKDHEDFKKAKAIIMRAAAKQNDETVDNHTTPSYIWRTQQDGKVRASHAVNNGRRFAWVDELPTGHPGEDYNCRCWAEPLRPGELKEYVSQKVISAVSDEGEPWSEIRLAIHYLFGGGTPVFLDEIGHLQNVIDHARTYDQRDAGGGTLFERVEKQIITEIREKGRGAHSYHFNRGYSFRGVRRVIGGANVIEMANYR